MDIEQIHKQFLRWRGITSRETECKDCGGSGRKMYSNTATWRGGMGGCTMTPDVCNKCWGTGCNERTGADLAKMQCEVTRLQTAQYVPHGT